MKCSDYKCSEFLACELVNAYNLNNCVIFKKFPITWKNYMTTRAKYNKSKIDANIYELLNWYSR